MPGMPGTANLALPLLLLLLVVCLATHVDGRQADGDNRFGGSAPGLSCSLPSTERIDCAPFVENVDGDSCAARGCCWSPSTSARQQGLSDMTPWCYYPANAGYAVANVSHGADGSLVADLVRGPVPSPWGSDIKNLRLEVVPMSDAIVRVRISDPAEARWEVPDVVHALPPSPPAPAVYGIELGSSGAPMSLRIFRTATNVTLLDTSLPGMVFTDTFLSLASRMPAGYRLYGLGEHVDALLLDTNFVTYTEFARDRGTPVGTENLYGAHPMYVSLETTGTGHAHGMFLLSSNGIDVKLSPNSLEWRTIGGVLDLYLMVGQSPDHVVSLYTDLVGKPYMPPMWALGFHLCRWGYDSLNRTREVNMAMRAAGLPQDVQWNDIDYMDRWLDFTTDPVAYPAADMAAFIDELHAVGQRYVPIIDPGISYTQPAGSYPPYDDGVADDVFIKASPQADHTYAQGKVWPGKTVFPDFSAPQTTAYWTNMLATFHDLVPYDGVWIDMNEPANIPEQPAAGCPGEPTSPYALGGQSSLTTKTICLGSRTALGPMWNTHSLYGLSEMVASRTALDKIIGKRSLILSRSTFASSGAIGAHWLGDNKSTWSDLLYSISGILQMNMFGIPLVGADVCGFIGTTTPELCTRWMQLGAFYPFYRNHNIEKTPSQAPYVFGEPYTSYIRDAMVTRYTLMPYLYTAFYTSAVTGIGVARPLAFAFPTLATAPGPAGAALAAVDLQYVLGDALVITPVVTEGAQSVTGTFPSSARFFALDSGKELMASGQVTLSAPLSHIPVHVIGGNVVPMQAPANNTATQTGNPYALLVALSDAGTASGSLFVDDGETIGTIDSSAFFLARLTASWDESSSSGHLAFSRIVTGYAPAASYIVDGLRFYGVPSCAGTVSVSVNGSTMPSGSYDPSAHVLTLPLSGVAFGEGQGQWVASIQCSS
ncbi:acid alpha glucosidase [Thecamonas trahens ATCC 50062]|uniref:alpha-glucosidase n=1 Tax=Thecamonas trahens ATCC 50062 TaxID=461836 RepID=A0A0L0D138_THETB|nr:acid alpha glucosidase [Thecamonas trahens ATCC 50062]KNC45946.1 acid alpha glucosidase [Thecamonas trahens ATCC 50062]|eukprot:XP_013762929.1 acid alpha glucosidase [Thecamonas trahens ATCC 50062]